MTDKELSTFGEKLYAAILETPLPSGRIFALAGAIRQGVAWAKLPPPLKIAVFKIAARCLEGLTAPAVPAGPTPSSSTPEPAGADEAETVESSAERATLENGDRP
jgi:hypothetical protein